MTSSGTQMYTYDRCSSIFSRIQGKDCVDNPTAIEICLETPISLATRYANSPVRVQPSKRIKLTASFALKNLDFIIKISRKKNPIFFEIAKKIKESVNDILENYEK